MTRIPAKPIDVGLVRSVLSYNPETGSLRWISSPKAHLIGREAGSLYGRYRYLKINGERYACHRVAWAHFYGEDPGPLDVDHINHDRADNRITNLRLVEVGDNARNMSRSKRNKSGHPGVYFRQRLQRWEAWLSTVYLGSYPTKADAVAARDAAALSANFHPNHGA